MTSSSQTVRRTLYIQRPGVKSDLSQFGKSVSISYKTGGQIAATRRCLYELQEKPVRIELAKAFKPFGVRVQRSVFECWLTSAGLKTLLERMDEIIDPKIDSVRCYPLCESCRYLARTQGLTECKEPKNTFII